MNKLTEEKQRMYCDRCSAKIDVTGLEVLTKFCCPNCEFVLTVPQTPNEEHTSVKMENNFIEIKHSIDKKKRESKKKRVSSKKAEKTKANLRLNEKNHVKKKSLSATAKKAKFKKSQSSSKAPIFIVVGIFIFLILILLTLPGGQNSGSKKIVSEKIEPEQKGDTQLELQEEAKRKKEAALLKEAEFKEEAKRKKEAALLKEAELQEEAKRKKEAALLKEAERKKELEDFLALVKPSEDILTQFNVLPTVSASYVNSLVSKHCVECHNAKKTKGDLNLDVYMSPESLIRGYESLKHAFESVSHGDMPPDEDDMTDAERRHFISYFRKLIYTLESKPPKFNKAALIRRLTPYEYDNTISDITGLDLKLGDNFPTDGGGNQGFTNDASVMGVSPILMEKYMEAAEKLSGYSSFDLYKGFVFNKEDADPMPLEIFESRLKERFYGFLKSYYPNSFSVEKTIPKLMKSLAEITLNTSSRQTLEEVARRNKIHSAFVKNGIRYFSSSAGKSDIEHKALKKWKSLKRGKFDSKEVNDAIQDFLNFYKLSSLALSNRKAKDRNQHVGFIKNVELIFTVADEIAAKEIQGSQFKEYKKAIDIYLYSRFALNVREGKAAYSNVRPIIQDFLNKLYRRPPSDTELNIRVKDFLEDSLIYGMPIASRIMVIREFSSVNFFFRIENKRSSVIDDYDLASRLSYFLWAGPPDVELLNLASRKELKKEEVLIAQINRMLKDKKSARLAKHFANQWLKFGEILGFEGPSKAVYSGFDEGLARDMWQETAMCFNYIVKNDRNLLELVDADYTIINSRLGRLYGIGQSSSSFKKVRVNKSRRGGILGHASFLTMTSMGQRTSPIVRGNWVLTTLLGVSIPPPPMDVPELPDEEIVNENFTLEQQLAKHRNVAACRGCHKKIDPLGIVLENYDVVGRWRNKYQNASIVSNAKINGMEIKGLEGLKKYILQNKVQFIRNLSRKLVSYALGRSTYFYDNYLINNMIENAIRSDYRFSSLVKTLVLSPQFQHK